MLLQLLHTPQLDVGNAHGAGGDDSQHRYVTPKMPGRRVRYRLLVQELRARHPSHTYTLTINQSSIYMNIVTRVLD